MREFILQGYKVVLGTIGSLEPEITSTGAVSLEAFTENNIDNYYVNFRPSEDLMGLRADVEFEQTTTRAAQKATLKAQKAGQTAADWTPRDDEEEEEEPEP